MSRRKPSRTKERYDSFDTKAFAPKRRDLTGQIAYMAARLIAEEGMTDFDAAKKKAARQIGFTALGMLPSNQEVDAALRSFQAIFQGESQPLECRALRETAVDLLLWLDRFSPWLVGSVLIGTANVYSNIELEIVADDPKRLEMFFFNEGIPFETSSHRVERRGANAIRHDHLNYLFTLNEVPVVIAFYCDHARRLAHHPGRSGTHARARLADVVALLDANQAGNAIAAK